MRWASTSVSVSDLNAWPSPWRRSLISDHLGERRLHRALEPARRLQVMLDEVGEHLGVGLGPERVALALEAILDLQVVLEDPVVDDDELAAAVGVGMRVLVRLPRRARPARV